jgi:hypothetical protein
LSWAQRSGAKSRQLIARKENRGICGCITGEYQARSAPYNSNELTDVVEGLPAQNLLEQITELFFARAVLVHCCIARHASVPNNVL